MATQGREDEDKDKDKSKSKGKDDRSTADEAEHQQAKQLDEGTESPG